MELNDKIYVAGHRGMVGSAILRKLENDGYNNIITVPKSELDLRNRYDLDAFFEYHRPEYVFLAAAVVGGIGANSNAPSRFIHDNLAIQTNAIDLASRYDVKKFLFLGSSCIYPRLASQPITEDQLLTGPLEPTNEAYAIAKIAGIGMCQAYAKDHGFNAISLMPTNLYGPGDNFNLETSHVIPAIMRKLHEAKDGGDVVVWGTGTPMREFLHVDDLADACCHLMQNYNSPEIINVGTGVDMSISDLVSMMRTTMKSTGRIVYDTSRPDGMPRKLLDVSKITDLGWKARINMEDGIQQTYEWFLSSPSLRGDGAA